MSEEVVKFRDIKPEIRVLGIDDGDFSHHEKGTVDIVGVVFRGGYWLEGIMRTEIEVDGLDATEKIVTMIKGSPHYKQLRVIMLDGVTFAGFNFVNIRELFEKVRLPVIVIVREKPNFMDIKRALKHLPKYMLIRGLVFSAICLLTFFPIGVLALLLLQIESLPYWNFIFMKALYGIVFSIPTAFLVRICAIGDGPKYEMKDKSK